MNIETIPTALGLGGGELVRVTASNGSLRYYQTPDGDAKMKSVTGVTGTVIRKPGLERWRESLIRSGGDPDEGREMEKGSNVHNIIDEILRGHAPVVDDEMSPAIAAFNDWRKDYPMIYLEGEVAVYNEKLGYAGTVDAIFKDNHKLILVDWKTSNHATVYPESMLQIRAYINALKSMGYSHQIGGMIVNLNKDKDKNFNGTVSIADVGADWDEEWWATLRLFKNLKRKIEVTTRGVE